MVRWCVGALYLPSLQYLSMVWGLYGAFLCDTLVSCNESVVRRRAMLERNVMVCIVILRCRNGRIRM